MGRGLWKCEDTWLAPSWKWATRSLAIWSAGILGCEITLLSSHVPVETFSTRGELDRAMILPCPASVPTLRSAVALPRRRVDEGMGRDWSSRSVATSIIWNGSDRQRSGCDSCRDVAPLSCASIEVACVVPASAKMLSCAVCHTLLISRCAPRSTAEGGCCGFEAASPTIRRCRRFQVRDHTSSPL